MGAFNPHSLEPFWDSWCIDSLIGEGSFGSVYKIYREDFGTRYYSALKIITVPKTEAEEKQAFYEGMDGNSATQYFRGIVEELYKEISIMTELKGKNNIVSYEDHKIVQRQEGVGFHILIRMELLESLNDYILRTGFNTKQIVNLGKDLCRALILCQKRGLIHRDIKPANIFVSRDEDFKLGDFGIARRLEGAGEGLSIKGNYSTMAPEVYLGNPYNESVDIYSVGMVLYYYLNNRRAPFLASAATIQTHGERQEGLRRRFGGEKLPKPVFASNDHLAEVVLKACEFDPKDRYQSPEEFLKSLEELQISDLEKMGELIATTSSAVRYQESEDRSRERTEDESENATVILGDQDLDGTVILINKDNNIGDNIKDNKMIEDEEDYTVVLTPPDEISSDGINPPHSKSKVKFMIAAGAALLLCCAVPFIFWNKGKADNELAAVDSANLSEGSANKAVASDSNIEVEPAQELTSSPELIPTPEVYESYEVIRKNENLKDLSEIDEIERVTLLSIDSNQIESLDALKDSVRLEYLSVEDNELSDIGALAGLKKLTVFNVRNNKIRDISALKELTSLEVLVLSENEISSIDDLVNLVSLSELRIATNHDITDISVIENMKQLQILILSNTGVRDISPLYGLENLILLDITNTDIPESQIEQLKERQPDCEVIY